jgi:SAM-dependent methyltransferase
MKRVLEAWLAAAARGADHVESCRAAAEVVASDPWAVVEEAGALARATPDVALEDLWLDERLRVRSKGIAFVPRGAPYPRLDRTGKKRRGAFDTPRDMARRVVELAGEGRCARDIACGTGAFLVALGEAGVREVEGIDSDPAALAVASIAAPRARLVLGDGLEAREPVDLVVGNPPFVPPERQDKVLRRALQKRFPWMVGRFDLAVPFAATALEQVRSGGSLALVVPWGLLTQPYAAPLRRRWLSENAITALDGPIRFPGATVDIALIAISRTTPARLPNGVEPAELLRLASCPLDPSIAPGDAARVEAIRAESIELGDVAEIDTGVVSHGPGHGKHELIFDEPGDGRVPYVDAQDLIAGRVRWLAYRPERMHRSKRPELFEGPKVLVQRVRGDGPIRAWIDRAGQYAGHTLTVVRPTHPNVSVDDVYGIITSERAAWMMRVECGRRLDMYPKDIRRIAVPRSWTATATSGAGSV